MGFGADEGLRKGQADGPQARRRSRRPGAKRRGVPPEGRDGLRPDAGTLQGDAEEAGAGGQRGALQGAGEGTLQEPGGPQGNPPGGRVWGAAGGRPPRRRSRRPFGPVSSRFGRVQ